MKMILRSFAVPVLLLGVLAWGRSAAAQQRGAHGALQPAAGRTAGAVYHFDGDKAGSTAAGMTIAETAGAGKTATWEVVADGSAPSQPNAFGITRNKNYGHTFNLALASKTHLKDVDVSVQVKAVAGKEDQGGGPVWRALDADNYYIARWNPLEENFRVYYVKAGRRKQLGSAKVSLDTKKWHTVRAVMRNDHIECFLDGKKLLVVDDRTMRKPGMVGLWVKADGRTLFDDFTAGAAN